MCRVIRVTTPPCSSPGVGDQRHLLQEVGQRPVRVAAVVLPRDRDQLVEVLDPALVLQVGRGLQLGQVPGPFQHGLGQVADRGAGLHVLPQPAHQLVERLDRPGRPGGQGRHVLRAGQGPGKADLVPAGQRRHALLGPVADAPPRHVQHPAQRHLVLAVGDQPQVAEQVADLAPLVEPDPADDLVRQPGPDEDLLKHPGLCVGPVEHRHLPRGGLALVGEPVHLLGHERRLVVLVVGDIAGDRRPVARLRPELLRHPAGVAGDDRVGRGQDVLGGAVVLLKQDDRGTGKIPLELVDVPDRGAAEGVDGLVGVAHHAQLGGRARRRGLAAAVRAGELLPGQLRDQHVLRVVGVLVLVYEHMPEPGPVLGGHLGERLQQVDRDHDQVVEVHGARRDQPALVLGVGLGQRLLPVAGSAGGERLVVDELVLEAGDLGGHRLRRMVLDVELKLAADQGHQPLRVGLVVDRERGRVAEPLALAAQDPHAGGVERHQPHGPRP